MDGKTIVEKWWNEAYEDGGHWGTAHYLLVDIIDAALAQARAEEREACAEICEWIGGTTGEELASRIRARTP